MLTEQPGPRIGDSVNSAAPQRPAVFRSKNTLERIFAQFAPGRGGFHQDFRIVQDEERAGIVGEQVARGLTDHAVRLFEGQTALQKIAHLVELADLQIPLLQFTGPIHQVLVGLLQRLLALFPVADIHRHGRNPNNVARRVTLGFDRHVKDVCVLTCVEYYLASTARAVFERRAFERLQARGLLGRPKFRVGAAYDFFRVESRGRIVNPRIFQVQILVKDGDPRIHERKPKAFFAGLQCFFGPRPLGDFVLEALVDRLQFGGALGDALLEFGRVKLDLFVQARVGARLRGLIGQALQKREFTIAKPMRLADGDGAQRTEQFALVPHRGNRQRAQAELVK